MVLFRKYHCPTLAALRVRRGTRPRIRMTRACPEAGMSENFGCWIPALLFTSLERTRPRGEDMRSLHSNHPLVLVPLTVKHGLLSSPRFNCLVPTRHYAHSFYPCAPMDYYRFVNSVSMRDSPGYVLQVSGRCCFARTEASSSALYEMAFLTSTFHCHTANHAPPMRYRLGLK